MKIGSTLLNILNYKVMIDNANKEQIVKLIDDILNDNIITIVQNTESYRILRYLIIDKLGVNKLLFDRYLFKELNIIISLYKLYVKYGIAAFFIRYVDDETIVSKVMDEEFKIDNELEFYTHLFVNMEQITKYVPTFLMDSSRRNHPYFKLMNNPEAYMLSKKTYLSSGKKCNGPVDKEIINMISYTPRYTLKDKVDILIYKHTFCGYLSIFNDIKDLKDIVERKKRFKPDFNVMIPYLSMKVLRKLIPTWNMDLVYSTLKLVRYQPCCDLDVNTLLYSYHFEYTKHIIDLVIEENRVEEVAKKVFFLDKTRIRWLMDNDLINNVLFRNIYDRNNNLFTSWIKELKYCYSILDR
jgi:hypothetical protein